MFRKRLPFTQMAFATIIGVMGGVYIYRPYFEPLQKSQGVDKIDVSNSHSEDTLSMPELGHSEVKINVPVPDSVRHLETPKTDMDTD